MTLSALPYVILAFIVFLVIIGLFWWIFSWLLFRSVDLNLRRCPKCKRGGTGTITETTIEQLGIQVDRSKLTVVRTKREEVTDYYSCDRCGHQWTRSFTRQQQLPVQKTPNS